MKTTIKMFVAISATLLLSLPAQAGFISGVTKTGGNASCGAGGCPDLDVVALNETNLARNDRTHTLLEIPDELMEDNATQPDEVAEMVQLSNSDKSSDPLVQEVTLSRLSVLYVGIDNRQFGGSTDELQDTQYSWMSDTSFTGLPSVFLPTSQTIGVDENGNGEANQYFTLFAAIAPAGTFSLGVHEGGDNNMYIVLADDHVLAPPIPEPSTLALAAISVLGLGLLRRRK